MRRSDGRETWHRLLEWDKGQAPAERLAAVVLFSCLLYTSDAADD